MIRNVIVFTAAPLVGFMLTYGVVCLVSVGGIPLPLIVVAAPFYLASLLVGAPIFWFVHKFLTLTFYNCILAALLTSLLSTLVVILSVGESSKSVSELTYTVLNFSSLVVGIPAIISGAFVRLIGFTNCRRD